MTEEKLLLVKANALPSVYEKVVKAKQLLTLGEVKTASEASKMCGISRSAFYKYKDSVFEYNSSTGKIFTLHAILKDNVGVLSVFLSVLHKYGVNIITVNQGIPVLSVAEVSVTARASCDDFDLEEVLKALRNEKDIVSVKQILSE